MKKNNKPCDSCGRKTDIGIDETNIEEAEGYMHGKGLLCEKCWLKEIAVRSRYKQLNHDDKIKLINDHFKRRQKRWGNIE
jgi:hypothetical protein